MEMTTATTVRDIVRNDHRAAAVLEKYAIDFCCGGDKPLHAVCATKGIDPAAVWKEIAGLQASGSELNFRPGDWDLAVLTDFIVNNHHRYVRRALPQVTAHLEKIVAVHGRNHPELQEIAECFHRVADELTQHMQKEEVVLFPYIVTLADAHAGSMPARPPFGTIRRPIQMMEAEHQSAGDAFAAIRRASGGYTLPPDACDTFRVTFKELADFERDLHQHIHLENNILFPRAIELEDATFA